MLDIGQLSCPCPGEKVPNSDQTSCICPHGKISVNDQCQICSDGYVPNANKTECICTKCNGKCNHFFRTYYKLQTLQVKKNQLAL